MRLLSASGTFAWKATFPVGSVLFLVWLVAAGSLAPARGGGLSSLAGGLLLIGFGSVFHWLLTWNLADEVADEGDRLRITRRGVEALVPLEQIVAVRRSLNGRPRRVVLEFGRPTPLGREIAFLPAGGLQEGGVDVSRLVWQRAEAARAPRVVPGTPP